MHLCFVSFFCPGWHGIPKQQPTAPSKKPGWDIEIVGGTDSIDMSDHKFFRWATGPYRWLKPAPWATINVHMATPPIVWMCTSSEEAMLSKDEGAKRERPPMGLVARFLEALEGKGYHVVASHSTVIGEGVGQNVTHMWTLKHAPSFTICFLSNYCLILHFKINAALIFNSNLNCYGFAL